MKKFYGCLLLILLTGCSVTSPSVPKGYEGETATVDDTLSRIDNSSASIFYIDKINDKNVHNSLIATQNASMGQGLKLTVLGASRTVTVQPIQLHIAAQVYNAAPILHIFADKNYLVEGTIQFTPKANESYIVSGKLSDDYSAVWLENTKGEVVSDIIEKKDKVTILRPHPLIENQNNISRKDYFSNIKQGASREYVLKVLGRPNSITTKVPNDPKSKTIYIYPDLGQVEFSQFRSPTNEPLFVEKTIELSTVQHTEIAISKVELLSGQDTQIADIINNINSGNIDQQKQAIKLLVVGGITDPTIYDLLENKLQTTLPMSTSNTDIDNAAWLIRGLGYSGNRKYSQTLNNIVSGSYHKKLKKYANQALENLDKYKYWNTILGDKSLYATDQSQQNNALANALRSDDLELMRLAAKRIMDDRQYDDFILAVLSNELKTPRLMADDKLAIDTYANMAKALASSGNTTYRDVIENIATTSSNKKLKNYAESYLKKYY